MQGRIQSRGSIIRSAALQTAPAPSRRTSTAPSTGSAKKRVESSISQIPPRDDSIPIPVATFTNQPRSSTRSATPKSPSRRPSSQTGSIRTSTAKLSRGASLESSKSSERERDKYYQHRKADELEKLREEKRMVILDEIRKERITMLIFSCICCVSGIFWIVALSIDHWYFVEASKKNSDIKGQQMLMNVGGGGNQTLTGRFIRSRNGLWKYCRITLDLDGSGSESTTCKYHALFPGGSPPPSDSIQIQMESFDQHVIDYQRTQISFAIISIILLPMALIASFYTFKNSRYTYKRLTACLYFLLAVTVLVVIEVVITCVNYQRISAPYHHPKNSSLSYGFCFYTGWVVFLIYLVTAALFLAYSRKRKGDKALDDDDEDAEYMGR